MYNLQVPGAGMGVGGGPGGQGETSLATTPRTPEILNSLIAMTNPFESAYRSHASHHAPRLASSPPGGSDNSTSSSGSGGCVSPPSVQHTCSQLIKEGLKLTIQSKRRQSQRAGAGGGGGRAGEFGEEGDDCKMARRDEVRDDDDDSTGEGLTPEDEERRKRRRERNKIAATKCRLKKRERTVNLVHESEILENQNHDLKSQIQELETQRRRLVDMLSIHRPSCQKQLPIHAPIDAAPTPFPTTTFQTFGRQSTMMEAGSSMFRRINVNAPTYPRAKSTIEATASYHRIEMSSSSCVETPYQRIETVLEDSSYGRPDSVYHGFETEVKDGPTTMLVPYCKANSDCAQSSPTFTQIGEQFPCQQNFTDLDRFVKPELPAFHGPTASYGRPPSYDSAYQHYEESETFISTDFTSRSALPD